MSVAAVRGSCLCGDVVWEVRPSLVDDDPGIRIQRHIFVGSKAPWYEIADGLPQHAEYPPAS